MIIKPDILAKVDDPVAFVDELVRRDFSSFVVRAFPYINGGASLIDNWHIDAISYHLEQVRHGRSNRLLVTIPPRMLKSKMISAIWVAWRLGLDPTLNFVCISYSDDLAKKHAYDCRAILQSAWYRRLFPKTIIAKDRGGVSDFQTTAGGGRLTTSVEGTLTGRGGDIIIIDDPIKPADALSDTVRTKVNDWFVTTLVSRLNDRTRGAIIIVMQRLHQYDLVGMQLEAGGWDLMSLPAIATETRDIPLTRGRIRRFRAGEALYPQGLSIAQANKTKADVGSTIYAAQYLQEPLAAKGNLIRTAWLGYYERSPVLADGGLIVQSWDTASKDGLFSDWSVCITALVQGPTVFILDVWRRRVDFPALKAAAIEQARGKHATVLLVEDAASGTQLIQTLRNEKPSGVPQPIARRPEADKRTRVAGVSAMIEAGQLLLPREAAWLIEFKQELLAFPSARFDDQVDALSQLLIWVGERQRNRPVPNASPITFETDDYGMTRWSDGVVETWDDPDYDPWSGL